MFVFTVVLCVFIVVIFTLLMVFEYKKYKLRMAQMSSDMEKSSQTFEEHQQAMNDDANVQAQKDFVYRYKKSQLEQDLQTAYDQESTLPHSDDDGDGDESRPSA